MSQKIEIGYLCSRGHIVFRDHEDGCSTKRIAGVFIERDEGVEFCEPHEEADPETGFVWYSSSGYSESDYLECVDEALRHIAEWRSFWEKQ